jgi:hypothetical protein
MPQSDDAQHDAGRPGPFPSGQSNEPPPLSPEEVQRRLMAAAKILANGAIRAAMAARQRHESAPAG